MTYLGFNLQIMFYHFSNYLHISYNNLFIRKKKLKRIKLAELTSYVIADVIKCGTHFTVNFVTKVTLWTIWHEMLPSVKIGRNRSNKFSKNDIFLPNRNDSLLLAEKWRWTNHVTVLHHYFWKAYTTFRVSTFREFLSLSKLA